MIQGHYIIIYHKQFLTSGYSNTVFAGSHFAEGIKDNDLGDRGDFPLGFEGNALALVSLTLAN